MARRKMDIIKPVTRVAGAVSNEFLTDFAETNVPFLANNREFLPVASLAVGLAGEFFSKNPNVKAFFEGMTTGAGVETVRQFTPLLDGSLGLTAIGKRQATGAGQFANLEPITTK